MHKKLLSGLLAVSMALTAVIGFTACGWHDKEDGEGDEVLASVVGTEGLAYTLSDDGTYYIASGIGTCTATEIVIGNTYNDLSVTSIGDYAFMECAELTSVTISEGITSIQEAAFAECYSLTSITIPSNVETIGDFAFNNCRELTSITIPKGVTRIGARALAGCRELTEITIPNSVTSIGEFVFSGSHYVSSIWFEGTKAEWRAIEKEWWYFDDTMGWLEPLRFTIQCTDGKLFWDDSEID